ncbi:MAG: hypothetical protein RLP12_01280 [Ekhidna sp.]
MNYLDIKMPVVRMDYRTPYVRVTSNSPKKHRNAVEQIAKLFKKETGYDCVQYSSMSDNSLAILFIDHQGMNITPNDKWDLQTTGAVCFRNKIYENHPDEVLTLDWIWIHPFQRGREHLETKFNSLVKEFGYFFISHPRSKAMNRFLEKINYPTEFEDVIKRIRQN